MRVKMVIKLFIILLVIVFFYAYIIETSGYYEYSLKNKTTLTREQIKRFEEDVRNGRDVDITDYSGYDSVDYSNRLTRATTNFSLRVNYYLKDRIRDVFRVLNDVVMGNT